MANANITKSMTFNYVGQKIVYQCDPGFEIPLVLLEEVNVSEPVKEPIGLFGIWISYKIEKLTAIHFSMYQVDWTSSKYY